MYDLFEQISTVKYGARMPPEFDYIRRTYRTCLDKLKAFYRSRQFSINNDHILVRLIRSASISQAVTDERFYEITSARSPYIGKYFNFTSSLNYGALHHGEFYGKGIKEIILAEQEIFDPLFFTGRWEDLSPVTALYHPFSDLKMIVPDGREYGGISGHATIKVDIAMLLYQYRRFLQASLRKLDSDETDIETVQTFLKRFVLPNMLDSHLDVALMNRFYNLFYKLPMSFQNHKHPLALPDYTDKVDRSFGRIIADISAQKKNYEAVLMSIPAVSNESQDVSLLMPDYIRTRQVWWALLFTRLPYIKLLIDLGGEPGIGINRHLINDLLIAIRYLSSDNSLSIVLDQELQAEAEMIFLHVLNLTD